MSSRVSRIAFAIDMMVISGVLLLGGTYVYFYVFSLILPGSSIWWFDFLIGKESQKETVFFPNLACFLGTIWLMQEFKDWDTRAHLNSGNPDGLCRAWKHEEFPISLFQSFSLKKTEQKPKATKDLDKNLRPVHTVCAQVKKVLLTNTIHFLNKFQFY